MAPSKFKKSGEIKKMTIHEHLLCVDKGKYRACEEARLWAAQYKTAQEVWDNCQDISWLFWWAARMGQHIACAMAAKEIANSVSHLKNNYAAAVAAAAAAVAADAAAYAAYAVDKQKELNMAIARKYLVCPWHEDQDQGD